MQKKWMDLLSGKFLKMNESQQRFISDGENYYDCPGKP